MKVQCPKCKDIVEMRDFRTSAEGLEFRCVACGKHNFLANADSLDEEADDDHRPTELEVRPQPGAGASKAVPASVFVPGEAEVLCPKCGHSQLLDTACHRCGLMFERFDPANLPPDPERACSVWEALLQDPENDELHEQFLDTCQRLDRLDFASRQYRMLTRSEPHREKAELMLDRIFVKAQAQLGGQSLIGPVKKEPSRMGKIILWVVFAMLAAGAIGYMAYSFHLWSTMRV